MLKSKCFQLGNKRSHQVDGVGTNNMIRIHSLSAIETVVTGKVSSSTSLVSRGLEREAEVNPGRPMRQQLQYEEGEWLGLI